MEQISRATAVPLLEAINELKLLQVARDRGEYHVAQLIVDTVRKLPHVIELRSGATTTVE